ncbi:hypothetical protein AKJ41_00935 [candidate division MSBL1 archaeon SCGC-AAA259O05]|uniref:Uncharacterized protein n=1 Tax=candidate division MSBL1 archaeon SCGC-AAA259O05 TaxID=1698271 RepID=A0A133V5A7_9EURY|nr:hypothetical protein AKJ41_00935 [candidate division MSBL1 archaeon SCGC-AAA259O05]
MPEFLGRRVRKRTIAGVLIVFVIVGTILAISTLGEEEKEGIGKNAEFKVKGLAPLRNTWDDI